MAYCINCKRYFSPLGIARHRAMHRRKKDLVAIRLASGYFEYDYCDKGDGD